MNPFPRITASAADLRRLRLYYQSDPERLAFCVSTIHAILHIPDDVVNSGPVWTSWCFAMERICFLVKTCVTSRLHPYGTIDQRIKRDAQLQTIKFRYRLTDQLNFSLRTLPSLNEEIRTTETRYEDCKQSTILPWAALSDNCISLEDPQSALRSPRLPDFQLSESERRRLLGYLYGYYGASTKPNRDRISARVPNTLIRWAKVRRLDRVDKIRGSVETRQKHRDSSYIRVWDCSIILTLSGFVTD